MTDWVFTLLSREFGGLLLSLALLLLAVLAWRIASRWYWKLGFGLLAVAGLVLSVGAASHLLRYSLRADAYPPPGHMVDIGGYRVHVLAEGPVGGPAIVWLPGGHVGGLPMFQFHEVLRGEFRSILLDRPGTGWSDPGPFPRTTEAEAHEVMTALEAAGESGPFVFAGHSFGGLLAANIARRYPEQTAAVAMLDATPLDVVFYGIDRQGLSGIQRMGMYEGLRRAFGFYGALPEAKAPTVNAEGLVEITDPMALRTAITATPRFGLAASSIFEELTPQRLIPRAFDTVVYDGELGSIPVYLIAPGEDPTTVPYAHSVTDDPARAERFVAFLKRSRERYLAMSDNSRRIYAPLGTGHVFPDQEPAWLIETMREVVTEAAADWQYRQLTTLWPGPHGGVPPVDIATPASVEAAYRRALGEKRVQVDAISANTMPPSFNNTVLALEASGEALARIEALLMIFATTVDDPDYRALAGEMAPLAAALEDHIVQDTRLFQRIEAVYAQRSDLKLDPADARLLEVVRRQFVHDGAALEPDEKQQLSAINAELAALRTRFVQNTVADEGALVVWVNDASDLAGLPAQQVTAARAAATARERPGAFAIPIKRPSVWPVFTHADSRVLRESVWREWVNRGANPGEHDNRPVANQILKLRGEKAALLGFPSFAHYQTSARMAGTPEAALEMIDRVWSALEAPTAEETAELAALAAADGILTLEPWDRLYYAEKLRAKKFAFDSEALRPYLSIDNVVDGMIWAAGEVLGMTFAELEDIPVVSPDIRVFEVRRDGEILGVIYMDLFAREGKQPASWASQYRSHENFRGERLPVVALHSATQRPADGPVLVPWERANVIFHEFGHTLHTLSYAGRYPSLNSLAVPWDFIEVPSLLNERWFGERGLLKRFMTHYETGEPMPDELLDRLERVNRHNRVFSVTYNYLASAAVDMCLHLAADGGDVDAVALESQVIEDLGLPRSLDLTLYVPHAFHTFSKQYAAGMYTYLWSDAIAADAAEAFLEAPGGLYDAGVVARWREHILDAGNTAPIDDAYRAFRGRNPDPEALLRRFDLMPAEEN